MSSPFDLTKVEEVEGDFEEFFAEEEEEEEGGEEA